MKFLKSLIQTRRMKFDQIGVFVFLLIIVAWFGFGPSYFRKLIEFTNDISFYFHFHAFCMVAWLLTVLIQPILIRQGKIEAHKQVGKLSYALFPIMIASILLLIHSQLNEADHIGGSDFFIPFKDVMVMMVGYALAIYWRDNTGLHSRFMIFTIIPMIEPSLVRMFFNVLPPGLVNHSYYMTIFVVDAIILSLVINDFRNRKSKGVFLSLLFVMIVFQGMILSGVSDADWMSSLAIWYAGIG